MSYPVYLGRAPGPRGSWQGTSQCRDAQPYPNNGPNFQRRRKLKMWGWFGMYIGHVRAHLFSSQLLMGSKLLGIHDCLILLLADYFDMCWKCCIGGILRGWNSMESRWSCVPWLLPSWTMPYCNRDIITQPQQCIVVWFFVCVCCAKGTHQRFVGETIQAFGWALDASLFLLIPPLSYHVQAHGPQSSLSLGGTGRSCRRRIWLKDV